MKIHQSRFQRSLFILLQTLLYQNQIRNPLAKFLLHRLHLLQEHMDAEADCFSSFHIEMLYTLKDATIFSMELIVLSFLDVFAWSAVVSENFAALVAFGCYGVDCKPPSS